MPVLPLIDLPLLASVFATAFSLAAPFSLPLSDAAVVAVVRIPLTWIIAAALITTSGLSVIGGILMALDKRAAHRSANRVSERKLWLVAALGGWPGMYLVGQRIRHKTAKRSFRAAFVGSAAIHVIFWIAIVWLR